MHDGDQMSPRDIAQCCGRALAQTDNCAKQLGMQVQIHDVGHATAKMTVTSGMLNAHGTCHGGMIFTLADAAFGYACQSRNQISVAAMGSIDFLRPVLLDDELVAEATEQTVAGRQGIYDVHIHNQHGELVALSRAKSHRKRDKVIDDLPQG